MYKLGDVFEGQYPKDVAKFCNDNGYRIERNVESDVVTYTIVEGIEQTEDYNELVLDTVVQDSMNKQFSYAVKLLFNKLAPNISDTDVVRLNSIANEWTIGEEYVIGDVVRYDGQLYRALQNSTAQEIYPPDTYTSGWKSIGEPNKEGIYPWFQPLGAADAYALGAKVTYNGKIYESKIANNVWAPDVYGWKEVTSITEEPEEPSVEEYPEWVQPQGAHDAYSIGDKVTYNDRYWVSNTNGNVWVPGEYGWDEVV